MTDSLYLRLKPLNVRTMRGVTSPKSVIRVAAMHNLREIQAELGASATSGINPARMHLNYQLRGPDTADGVAGLALALLANAGVEHLRRDACMALELVFSLPPAATIDHREYFGAAVAWADAYFNAPILSAAVHLDESAPHCHVLVLPLVAGRMQGGALAGGPSKIRAMQSDFHERVAQRFGLTHQPRAKRLSKTNRDAAGHMVLGALKAHPERLNDAAVRDALAAALGQHHEALFPLLGLALPVAGKAKAKSFADIMTAPCKPERGHRARKSIDVTCEESTSIDVGRDSAPEIRQRLSCVDVALPGQHFQHDAAPPITSDEVQPQHPTDSQPAASAQNPLHTPAPAIDAQPGAVHELDAITAAPGKTGKSGNAAAPGGRASLVEVRFSDIEASPHQVDQTDAPAAASPPAAAHNRKCGASGRKLAHEGDHQGNFQRLRDTDYPASSWNTDIGDFAPATGPPGATLHHE